MTLKQKTFSALRWTTAAAIYRALLQVLQVAVLARLLSPEDYGLMAMVTVVISFAGMFADLGVNSALVQRQEITPEQRSSLFWLNISASLCICILVAAFSPLLANFFGDTRLTPLIMLSATTFVLVALGQQVRMSAEKKLDFRPVVIIETLSATLGFTVAILAALADWGVYSLVVSLIVSSFTGTVLTWTFLSHGWLPLWRFQIEDVRPFLGFGGALVANNVVNQINSTIDIFLGGRLLSATQLGLYSVPRNLALQVQSIINPIITRVGFPLIAQVQSDIPRVKSIYLKTLNMTSSTNAPIYVGIAFFSPEIVTLLLGAGWGRSGELLRILAIWGGVRSTGNPVGSLLFGMGRADLALKWNLGLMLIVPAIIWLGSLAGPEGMAWSMVALMVGLSVPGWYVLVRPLCHATLKEYAQSAFKPFVLAALAITPAYLLASQFEASIIRLIGGIALAAPLYILICFKSNRDWFSAMMELAGRRTAPR